MSNFAAGCDGTGDGAELDCAIAAKDEYYRAFREGLFTFLEVSAAVATTAPGFIARGLVGSGDQRKMGVSTRL